MRNWVICGIAVVGLTVAGCSESGAPSNFSGDYGANAAADSKAAQPKGNDADAMVPPPVPEYVPAGGNANKSAGAQPAANNPPKAADPANPSSAAEGSDAKKSDAEQGDPGKSNTSAAPQEPANSGNAPAAVGGMSVDDLVPPPVPGAVTNGANASGNQFTNPTRPSQGGGGKLAMLNPGAAAASGVAPEPGANPGSSNDAAAPAEKESFLQKAQASFQKFDESIGERYLYAHWLVDDKAKDEFPLEWVGGLKEPRLFVRWGVAVALDVPADHSGSLPVIGSGTNSSNLNPSGGGGRPGNDARRGIALDAPPPPGGGGGGVGGGSVPGDRTSPQASLRYCTGDFGTRLIKRFEMRRDSSPSYFGKILAQVTDGNVAAVRNAAPTNSGGGRLGMVDPEGAAPPVPGANQPAAQANARSTWQSPDDRFAAGTLIPGVYFLGVDDGKSEKQFVDVAKQMGLDALIVFKVDVNSRRNGGATSTTSAVVHNLKSDESQKTSSLNNESVAKAREKSKGAEDDPVEGELDKLFANFSDVQLKTGEMPELTADVVSKRVGKIATDSQPMAAIVEVVNYWRAGLLDAAAAEDFVAKATDAATAKALLSGTDEERIQALEKWLDQFEEPVTQGTGSFR